MINLNEFDELIIDEFLYHVNLYLMIGSSM